MHRRRERILSRMASGIDLKGREKRREKRKETRKEIRKEILKLGREKARVRGAEMHRRRRPRNRCIRLNGRK
jgi:hypothetical protein